MALVVLMEIYYVVEGNWEEYGAIHMMDITTDGFGFMLAFGDLAWVPFVYTVQARYLSTRTIEYPLWYAGIIVTLLLPDTTFSEPQTMRRMRSSTETLLT